MGKKGSEGAAKKTKKQSKATQDPVSETAAGDAEAVQKAPAAAKKILLSPIATPLADPKLKKRVLKLVKKAAAGKLLKRGVKEVVKALRKDSKGLCLIAGDISPLDVIAHLPIMCEDRDIPYLFIESKEELGLAAQSKRPTSCMLLLRKPAKAGQSEDGLQEYQETFDECCKRSKALQPVY